MCLEMAHTLVIKGIQDQVFSTNFSPFMHRKGRKSNKTSTATAKLYLQ